MSHPLQQFSPSHQAIVLTTPYLSNHCHHRLKQPNLLLSMQGQAMLHRVIAQLQDYGCYELQVVLGDDASVVKEFLQDGSRWGCRIQYHYVDGTESFGHCMRRIGVQASKVYWLADATCLPNEPLQINSHDTKVGDIACWREHEHSYWTGWGVFAGYWLLTQPHPAQMQQNILRDEQLRRHWQKAPLQVAQLADVLHGSMMLLDQQPERIQQGHGCVIHPSAKLIAPVYLGDQVKIAANAVIGPNVLIEAGSFIDHGTHIRDSLISVDTYVGHELNIEHSIVQGRLLANIPLNTVSEIADAHLLSTLTEQAQDGGWKNKLLGYGLRMLLAPLYVYARRQLGMPADCPINQISLPRLAFSEPGAVEVAMRLSGNAPLDAAGRITHFCQTFYPGLQEISRGKLALLGPQLRSWNEIQQLPQIWRQLYGEYRCGLLNESLLQTDSADWDEQFANDAYAAANQDNAQLQYQWLKSYLRQLLHALSEHKTTESSLCRHTV